MYVHMWYVCVVKAAVRLEGEEYDMVTTGLVIITEKTGDEPGMTTVDLWLVDCC